MNVGMNASVPVGVGMMSKGQLLEAIKDIPDDAIIDIYTSKGDRPWESDTYEIKFRWRVTL